jgi:anti-sigma regulatory factor (Ser/Thr protein kinase)
VREYVAERRLGSALAEQSRLTARYQDAVGTSGEFAAYARLELATLAVTNCDRALKALRRDANEQFSFVLVCGLDCPRTARAEVGRRIRGLVDPDVVEDVALLVSEVVTNAVKHGVTSGSATVALTGEVSERSLHVQVVNTGSAFEVPADGPENRDPGGRGLYLVDQLAHMWGVRHEDGQTTVWFELDREATPVVAVG